MKILAVDDDVIARTTLEGSITALGHDAVLAHDGDQARTLLVQQSLSVVISDWDMPGMDGLELCAWVRQQRLPHYVYFILLTKTAASPDNQARAHAAGVDDFLVKPARTHDLAMRLHVAARILDFMAQIQRLESFIPICSYCKNIRKDDGFWQKLEAYFGQRTGSQFSHCICPDCYEQHFASAGPK